MRPTILVSGVPDSEAGQVRKQLVSCRIRFKRGSLGFRRLPKQRIYYAHGGVDNLVATIRRVVHER